MKRGNFRGLIVSVVGLLLVVGSALADPPDLLRSYKFLPRLSTLYETGGIAGFENKYPVFGTYDFVTGFRYEPRIPADAMLTPYAQFANVKAYAEYPPLDPGLHLDVPLNLSGLKGTQIFRGPRGLELFRFEGTAGSDEAPAKVELLAARLGRWMYLRGSTEPSCCDFFEYELRGLAHETPSLDLDEDGAIGADDLGLWQEAYGTTSSGRDFLDWQRQHGDTAPSLEVFDSLMNEALAAMNASVVAVPEPAGACLFAAGLVCSCLARRFWV